MRALSEIEHRILDLVEPEARALGFDLVRVRMTGSRPPVLQIMAEKPDGTMDVADCAMLSRRLSPLLDAEDPIVGEYSLEVSSPGIDRPLTRPGDFSRWVGHEVRVEIGTPVDGRKRFHGFIAGEAEGAARLKLQDGGDATIPLSEMVKAHLVLTDELIKAAKAKGQAPAELADDEIEGDFDEVEVEDIDEDEEVSASDKRK
jgi:ribosome maturation factor RimP